MFIVDVDCGCVVDFVLFCLCDVEFVVCFVGDVGDGVVSVYLCGEVGELVGG